MALLTGLFSIPDCDAQRYCQQIDNDWNFRFSHQVQKGSESRVDLPHTWNAQDALSGKADYKRGVGNYKKNILIPENWENKRVFIKFDGAFSVTDLFINGKFVGEHRGGYGSFVFELTDFLKYGRENQFWIRVNNAEQLDVMPLVGDFNFYGGIYRNLQLVVTPKICISPLDYGSKGVRIFQEKVSRERAELKILADVSNGDSKDRQVEIVSSVYDGNRLVKRISDRRTILRGASLTDTLKTVLSRPHLWNGRKDPFMYKVVTEVREDGQLLDEMAVNLGLRFYSVDPDRGLFLNGEHLRLHGVCRHQDRAEVGNALHKEHFDEDARLMEEMGVNAVRLAHYPQSEYFYDLMDRMGIIVWAEIPFVGPGGYDDKGFIDSDAFRNNGKQQLVEMIRQHCNHPSILFWGLFNELSTKGDSPVSYIRELNRLAHHEDATRMTVAASNQEGEINSITDLIAWNRYDGWYGGGPEDLGKWLDRTHAADSRLRIGISEYGAGAGIYHQSDTLERPKPNSWWHPENWQTHYHIENWKILSQRPYVWGTFVWNMFDFGAAHRTEGDRPGINDKGLVTFDRKVRKDAFYFYKANWNKSVPVFHLCGMRNINRVRPQQTFMVFTNLKEAELWVNGRSYGKVSPDEFSTCIWENIPLKRGENFIKVEGKSGKSILKEEMKCNY